MKTILVTGAEGFVGSHLIQFLKHKGYDVVAGVRNRARKLTLEKRFGRALVCDVSDAINVARVIASVKPDGILHLAAMSRAGEAAAEPLTAYQSTVTAWANVLDGARRAVPRARVLMVSAADVYGATARSGQPLTEDAALDPVSTFGSLRATAETIAHTFFRNYHLNVSIARPFLHTGAGQSPEFYFANIAKRIAQWDAALGHQLALSDLDLRRDLCHVADVIDAYERILREGKPNEIYNVCTGQATTCREIVQNMMQAAGRELTLVDQPSPASDEEQIPTLCGSAEKLTRELRWQPKMSWRDAIRDLVHSYQTAKQPIAS